MSMCTVTWKQMATAGWYVNANLCKGKGDNFIIIKAIYLVILEILL